MWISILFRFQIEITGLVYKLKTEGKLFSTDFPMVITQWRARNVLSELQYSKNKTDEKNHELFYKYNAKVSKNPKQFWWNLEGQSKSKESHNALPYLAN